MIEGVAFANTEKIQESLRYMKEAVRLSDEARSKFPQDAELAGQRAEVGNRYANLADFIGRVRPGAGGNQASGLPYSTRSCFLHPENNHWRKRSNKVGDGTGEPSEARRQDQPGAAVPSNPGFPFRLSDGARQCNPESREPRRARSFVCDDISLRRSTQPGRTE